MQLIKFHINLVLSNKNLNSCSMKFKLYKQVEALTLQSQSTRPNYAIEKQFVRIQFKNNVLLKKLFK